jgi:zinc protease
VPQPDAKAPVAPVAEGAPRSMPAVAPVAELTFPAVQHAKLSNGIPVTLATRTAIPKVSISLDFDAGYAADGSAKAGTQSLMMDLLEEGTTSRSAVDIAEEQERLGASINTGTSIDKSSVTMTALTANLAPSLALMADIARHPKFAGDDVARVRDQRLAEIQQQQAAPTSLAQRALRPLVYGTAHPYGSVGSSGTTSVIEALTPDTLVQAHDSWLRPDLARITVVGNITMDQLVPLLEQAFGNWQAPAAPAPKKNLDVPVPPAKQRMVVIDRPNSPQSMIMMAHVLPITGTTPDMESLDLANQVIGDGFLSRLNMDLREDKGWTYYAYSSLTENQGPSMVTAYSPVQTDRTGDAIKAMIADMKAFPGEKGVDEVELQRVTDGNIRGLPNSFQTNSQVLGAITGNQDLGRPDDYYSRLPAIYGAIDAQAIDAAAAKYLQPDTMTIVVVGDRKQIDSQLAGLGIPIEYRNASEF